jgi:hypothetical protein
VPASQARKVELRETANIGGVGVSGELRPSHNAPFASAWLADRVVGVQRQLSTADVKSRNAASFCNQRREPIPRVAKNLGGVELIRIDQDCKTFTPHNAIAQTESGLNLGRMSSREERKA